MIDRAQLLSMLRYEPETGLLYWLINRTNGRKIGDVAGCSDKNGYVVIKLLDRQYFAHRLVWFYVHGEWPPRLDHKDGVKNNNRLENLREATSSQNCMNRRHQKRAKYLKGVSYSVRDRLFSAGLMKDGKRYHLGCFKTELEAHAAYCAGAERIFGEFARAA